MSLVFKKLAGVITINLTFMAMSTIFPSAVKAQDAEQSANLAEQFNQAFYQNDKPFWQNRRPLRQIDFLLGPGVIFRNSFTEHEIMRDGRAIHNLYVDAMNQQVASDPIIRTPDLPNPYNTSIFSQPSSAGGSSAPLGSQLNFGIPRMP